MDCRQCDSTLQKLKNAEWDTYEVKQERDALVKQSARIVRWLTLKNITIPENRELERMFP